MTRFFGSIQPNCKVLWCFCGSSDLVNCTRSLHALPSVCRVERPVDVSTKICVRVVLCSFMLYVCQVAMKLQPWQLGEVLPWWMRPWMAASPMDMGWSGEVCHGVVKLKGSKCVHNRLLKLCIAGACESGTVCLAALMPQDLGFWWRCSIPAVSVS